MIINTNIQATQAARYMNYNQNMLGLSISRLSSGNKIISPSDDAAGLAVSEQMIAANARTNAARTNVQNAISLVQTADGLMANMSRILTRMSELTAMARDVTKNEEDIALYQREFAAMREQMAITIGLPYVDIDGASQPAVDKPIGNFNGIPLFNGETLAVSVGEDASQMMNIVRPALNATGSPKLAEIINPAVHGNFSVSASATAGSVIDAIKELATQRANLGGFFSRLETVATQLQIQHQNIEAAVSRIRDVDVAEESTRFAKWNILVNSSVSMLSQANQLPQAALRLLQ